MDALNQQVCRIKQRITVTFLFFIAFGARLEPSHDFLENLTKASGILRRKRGNRCYDRFIRTILQTLGVTGQRRAPC